MPWSTPCRIACRDACIPIVPSQPLNTVSLAILLRDVYPLITVFENCCTPETTGLKPWVAICRIACRDACIPTIPSSTPWRFEVMPWSTPWKPKAIPCCTVLFKFSYPYLSSCVLFISLRSMRWISFVILTSNFSLNATEPSTRFCGKETIPFCNHSTYSSVKSSAALGVRTP